MKKRYFCIVIICLVIGIFGYKYLTNSNNVDDEYLININELSREFMDNYFEEYKELTEEEKEDMLIVISSLKIDGSEYGTTNVIEAPNNKYYLIFDDELKKENARLKLGEDSNVKSVEDNVTREVFVDENVSITSNTNFNSWGIKAMGLDSAMNTVSGMSTNDIVVAIVDTGLDVNLFNKYYSGRLAGTYNALSSDVSTSMYDNHGHGTHIAGTIAEGTPSNVKILPIKVSDNGSMSISDIETAYEYLIYYTNVKVVNLSFGGGYSKSEYQAIKAANDKGIISVAAAGNDNTSTPMYPAAFDNTISIASVDSSLKKSSFSNYGSTIDFTAPGTNIKSLLASYMTISQWYGNPDGDDDFETISGTSMATPHAVCAVAILKSINPSITLENTKDLLKKQAIDLGGSGFDIYYGNGLISFKNASFCTGENLSCDDFNIFKELKSTEMTISSVTYTKYNYGSITNILGTEISFKEIDGFDYTKKLWELEDLVITGYDPYGVGEQTVTLEYKDLNYSFKVTNPNDYESGWTYQLSDNKYYLSGYKDNNLEIGKLVLPEKIDNHTIEGILDSNSTTSILFASSSDASYIKEIVLPSNIINIGSYAFANLANCTKVTSKASEIYVNKFSFYNMSMLTTVDGSVAFVEGGISVFEKDISLTTVTISDKTFSTLPNSLFYGCESLKNITLPNSITTIEAFAFYNAGLTSIEFPSSLKKIGRDAFSFNDISSISFPESLETIGDGSFDYNNIESLNIPKNVKTIGLGAFMGNAYLSSIVVDSNNTYYDSRNNSNVIIETSSNKIIQGSTNPTIPSSVVTIGKYSFSVLYVLSLNIPEGVTTIEQDAFSGSGYLSKVVLPSSISSIHDTVFGTYDDDVTSGSIGASKSGSYTAIGSTVMWVNSGSYAHNYAVNNKKTYVLNSDNSKVVDIYDILYSLNKQTFLPGDKIEDYVKWIKYYYYSGNNLVEKQVTNFTVEYQNGNSISLNDYKVYIRFDLDNSYKNITIPISINVVEGNDDLELPDIDVVLDDYVCKYVYPNGTFTPYTCINYSKAGEYKVLGDFVEKSSGDTHYSVEVTVNVLDKELVNNIAERINAKRYDGTTSLDLDGITLYSSKLNLKKTDYTIVSAVLSSPNVGKKVAVTIKARINDTSFDKFAFSKNQQEITFTGYTTVYDFDIPTVDLLKNEYFYEYCLEDGCLKGYGSKSFSESGDYTILGYFQYNNSSEMIDNIVIPIHVLDKSLVDSYVQVSPKVYDGTTNIDFNTITLPGVDKSNYTIISAEAMSAEVSEYMMGSVKIKLNDSYYENYAFSGNKQEENCSAMFAIIKANPSYEVPQDLTAIVGQSLYDISLPTGFEWTSDDEEFTEVGNKTYYAKYTPSDTDNYNVIEDIPINISVCLKKYVVTYYSNYGDNNTYTQEIEENIQTSLSENTFVRSGYNFIGWNTNPNGSGTSYGDKQEVSISENLVLYAQWEESFTYIINKYSFDNDKKYIDKIDVNTTVDSFKNCITLNERYTIDVDYKVIDNKQVLYTGGKTKIYKDGVLFIEYTNIVRGDVSGDGKINYLDYVNVYNHIQKIKHPELDKKELKNEYLVAADLSDDGKVSYLDYVKIYNKIKELKGGK